MTTRPASASDTVYINARLIDPASGLDEPGGLLVSEGLIADMGGHLRRNAPDGIPRENVIDCKGHVLALGSSMRKCSPASPAMSTAKR